MQDKYLKSDAERLEQKIEQASASARLDLQPQLSKILSRLEADGQNVPARLRRLDAALIDEVIEARFDNMPV